MLQQDHTGSRAEALQFGPNIDLQLNGAQSVSNLFHLKLHLQILDDLQLLDFSSQQSFSCAGSGLSGGDKAGIAVGVIAGVALLAGATYFIVQRRR